MNQVELIGTIYLYIINKLRVKFSAYITKLIHTVQVFHIRPVFEFSLSKFFSNTN